MVSRIVFDAGPFVLLFTNERGSDVAKKAILKHEKGEIEVFIHPNNLSEAYRVIYGIRKKKPHLLAKDIRPELVVRSAYATLNVVYDEKTTVKLGALRSKYPYKPWGDLSSAALAWRLSDEEKVPVVILDEERHFKGIDEVASIPISKLKF